MVQTYRQQKFISHHSGGWMSKIRALAWLGSNEGPLLDVGGSLLCCVLIWQKGSSLLSFL